MAFEVGFILFLILLGAMAFVFWIMMLIDAITRKFKADNDRILWVLVVILVSGLGSLIYYFVVFLKDDKKSMKWFWWTFLALFVLMVLFGILTVISNVRVVY